MSYENKDRELVFTDVTVNCGTVYEKYRRLVYSFENTDSQGALRRIVANQADYNTNYRGN